MLKPGLRLHYYDIALMHHFLCGKPKNQRSLCFICFIITRKLIPLQFTVAMRLSIIL